MAAFNEIKPALGAAEEDLDALTRNGLIPYGPGFQQLITNGLSRWAVLGCGGDSYPAH